MVHVLGVQGKVARGTQSRGSTRKIPAGNDAAESETRNVAAPPQPKTALASKVHSVFSGGKVKKAKDHARRFPRKSWGDSSPSKYKLSSDASPDAAAPTTWWEELGDGARVTRKVTNLQARSAHLRAQGGL